MRNTESVPVGKPLQEFRPTAFERWGWFVIGGGVLIAGATLYLFALTGKPAAVLGGITIVAAGTCLALGYRRVTAQVVVFANGFSYRHGGRAVFLGREDIESIWDQSRFITVNAVPVTPVTRLLIIESYDGKRVKVSSVFRRIRVFASHVLDKVYEKQMPRAAALLEAGSELRFGRISISKAGIRVNSSLLPWNTVLPWDRVKGVETDDKGNVLVLKEGKWLAWATIPLSSTPNVFVLLPLIQEIMRRKWNAEMGRW